MIQQYVDAIVLQKQEIKEELEKKERHYNIFDYEFIFRMMLEYINKTAENDWEEFSVKDRTKINDGDYQGTLLFFCHRCMYQPSIYEYYWTHIDYGSCTGCDTMLRAEDAYRYDPDAGIEQLYLIMLHMAENMKPLITIPKSEEDLTFF